MRKRLRKRLRRAEFTELVFGVRTLLVGGLPARRPTISSTASSCRPSKRTTCGVGGGVKGWRGTSSSPWQAGGAQPKLERLSLATWLGNQPEVLSYTLGEFFDGWHGPEEAPSQLPLSEPGHRRSTALPNKGMKQTSVEHIGRSQLIPGVRRTSRGRTTRRSAIRRDIRHAHWPRVSALWPLRRALRPSSEQDCSTAASCAAARIALRVDACTSCPCPGARIEDA